jgi:methionyl-tRNA synthetase
MAKDPARRPELESAMSALARQLARQAICIFPFMPSKANALWQQLGAPGRVEDQRFTSLASIDAGGWQVRKGEALFPRAQTS